MLSIKFCDLIHSGSIDFVILFRSCSLFSGPIEIFLNDAADKLFINNYLVINQGSAEAETIYGEVADLATHGRTLCIQDDDTWLWDPEYDLVNEEFFPVCDPEPLAPFPEDGDLDGC